MRDRQASAYQYSTSHGIETDLEQRAEEAAYQAGKSVEDWLRDVILEQSAPANYPQNHSRPQGASSYDMSLRETKDAVLASLAERVKTLEMGQGARDQNQYAQRPSNGRLGHAINQAAENIGHNYDEDARILIEGIRARAQATQFSSGQSHSADPSHSNANAQGGGYHDAATDGVKKMLNTIEGLEQRLNQAPHMPIQNGSSFVGATAEASTENKALLSRIEERLEGLEVQLSDASMTERDNATRGNGRLKRTNSSKGPDSKASQARGRKALQRAIETIADDQNKQSPRRFNSADYDKESYKEANQNFLKLIKKIEELKRGTPSASDINALEREFARLRKDIVAGDGGETKAEISRLRDKIQVMQDTLVGGLDNGKLENLESDINRVAEFLLKQPDLANLPEKADTMIRDINRLSDGLIAVSDKHESSVHTHSEKVIGELEARLQALREDIVTQVRDNKVNPSEVIADFESRITDLRNHIDGTLGGVVDKVGGIENKVMSAAQKLEALQEMRNADSSVTAADFESRITDLRNHIDGTLGGVVDKVGGIENKVMSAAQQLETLQEMRSTDPDVAKQMALMEERLVGAAKRLEEASIDAASSNGGAPVALLDAVSNKELKQELDNLEARLGEAIKSGQEPANMLTPEQLKDELGGLADHLTQRLESKGSATGQAVVTDDILKDGLADLAHQVTERFTSERSIMLDHIDAAISKLQSLSPPSSTSSDDAIKVDGLQDGINGLQSSTESLSAQTQSSFESVQEMLNNVTERLHALEVSGSTVNNEAANNNPVDTSDAPELSQDTKSDSNNLSSKESVDKNTTKLIDDTPADLSVMSDEAIMERMREHVKARHPDEEPIEPSADDVPLKPGAGKPALEPVVFEEKDQVKATQARSDVEVQLENSAVAPTQKEEVRQEEAPQEPEPQEEAPRQSKSDFIAAARRAAQRASNEQSSLVEEIEEENSGSALSSIRDRISGAGKKVKPRRRGDKAATIDAALQNSPDAAQKFNEDLLDGSKGKVTRVKALSGVLAATLLISGYFTLKEPINELVSGLFQSTAAVERVSSPQQAAISIPAARPAQQIPVKPASQQAQVFLDVEQGADSDEAALDIASSGIDTSTTQSISPTNDIVEDVNLDPVLREALEGLPDEGISSKLADALIAANPSAFVEVARRFGQGDIFPRDIQQSAFWYKQAADRENPVAQYRLGTLYEAVSYTHLTLPTICSV